MFLTRARVSVCACAMHRIPLDSSMIAHVGPDTPECSGKPCRVHLGARPDRHVCDPMVIPTPLELQCAISTSTLAYHLDHTQSGRSHTLTTAEKRHLCAPAWL